MKKFIYVVLLLAVFAEILSIVFVANLIGWFLVIFALFIEILVGFSFIQKSMSNTSSMYMSGFGQNSNKIQYLITGILLAIPGFVSDVLIVLVWIPKLRKIFMSTILPFMIGMFLKQRIFTSDNTIYDKPKSNPQRSNDKSNNVIIDAEYEEKK